MAGTRGLRRNLDALLAVAAIWFLGQYIRYVLPPLFETFRGLFGVSNTTLGILFSAMMFAYAVMQFPSGALADRIGPVRVISGGALGVGLGAAVVVVAPTFAVLVLAVVVLGVAMGVHKTVAITLLSRRYPQHTGRAIGVLDLVGQLGGIVGPVAAVAVLSATLAWQSLFAAAAVAAVLLGMFTLVRLEDPPRSSRPAGARDRSGNAHEQRPPGTSGSNPGRDALRAYLVPFTDLSLVLAVAVAISFTVAWGGVSAFLPLYLTTAKGLPPARAGLLFSLLFAAGLIQPLTGAMGDRFGPVRVMGGTLSCAGLGLAGLLVVDQPWAIVGLVVVLGVGLHGFRAPRDTYLMAVIPDDVAGGTLGLTRSAMMLAGSAAPAAVGYLSDVASFGAAFGALLGVVLGGVAGVVWLSMRTA